MINLLSKINIFSENDYKEAIESSLKSGQKKVLYYLNSHVLYEAKKDANLEKNILDCDYLIADGYSIVWAMRTIFKRDISKVVFTYSYFKFIRNNLIDNRIQVFFLGADKKTISKGVEQELKNNSNLNVVGYHHGYFNENTDNIMIINMINKSEASVLIVGMGCPISENWIMEYKNSLNVNLIFSVGGFFDFLAENKISAPSWFYNSGLEWLFRLIQEPIRLFKRYLFANTFILFFILKFKFENEFKKK